MSDHSPRRVAFMDQWEAASREVEKRFDETGASSAPANVDLFLGRLADRMRDLPVWCRHVNTESPSPVVFLMGHGIVSCMDCASAAGAFTPRTVADDSCDACLGATNSFREVAVRCGAVVFHGCVCEPCFRDLMTQGEEDHEQ